MPPLHATPSTLIPRDGPCPCPSTDRHPDTANLFNTACSGAGSRAENDGTTILCGKKTEVINSKLDKGVCHLGLDVVNENVEFVTETVEVGAQFQEAKIVVDGPRDSASLREEFSDRLATPIVCPQTPARCHRLGGSRHCPASCWRLPQPATLAGRTWPRLGSSQALILGPFILHLLLLLHQPQFVPAMGLPQSPRPATCTPQPARAEIKWPGCQTTDLLVPTCRGGCPSSVDVDVLQPAELKSACQCCGYGEHKNLRVRLRCAHPKDPLRVVFRAVRIKVPITCACHPCSGQADACV